MKAKDIVEYEIGNHCFGKILRVNGKDYSDLTKTDVLEFINDMFDNDINSDNLIMETFEHALDYLQFDCVETDHDSCGQCGNWNDYSKYKIN